MLNILGVIDYSLYLTIDRWEKGSDFDCKAELGFKLSDRNHYISKDGKYIYQFGIIDYL